MTYCCLGVAACLALLSLSAVGASGAEPVENPTVVLDTTAGPITIELDPVKAPATVANFLKYVDSGFYDGLIFHRVIPGFMVQGGGMDEQMAEKETQAPVKNEAGNGLGNARGTIAMARTNDPDSATAQFFINLVENGPSLNRRAGSAGYTVFGKVTDGMPVVDAIAKVQTGRKRGHDDVPVTTITIKSAKRKAKP